MKTPVSPPARLAEHDTALANLLIDLLAEVPADAPTNKQLETSVPDGLEPALRVGQKPLNHDIDPPLAKGTAEQARVVRPRPVWAQQAFRALLFRIGKFRFAMPLVLMRSISSVTGGLTCVPGQPAWHRGLVRYRGKSVVVADLGLLLGIDACCREPRFLLVIGDGREAFECDAIDEAVLIDPDEVRWRKRSESGAWLAGLLAQQMCGLLDAGVIGRKFRHE